MLTLLLTLSISVTLWAVTPYPDTITLTQINGAEKERLRLAQGHKKFDRQPTGFYVEKGKKVVVTVEVIKPPTDGAAPILTIGTLGFNIAGRTYVDHTLKVGKDTITATNSGLIYLSYVTSKLRAPEGKVKVVFAAAPESEHVRAPRYMYGVTTDAEFATLLTRYPTPDVIYHSDYLVVAATRWDALKYKEDRKPWMDKLHTLLEKEDEISGMDNSDPNPVHHRLKAGEVRFLTVSNTSASPHASGLGYTGYPRTAGDTVTYMRRYLTSIGTPTNGSWLQGHEIGHQHQQPAYQINLSTESTVNIYSYVVERNIQAGLGNNSYNRTSAEAWKKVQDTYLKQPVENRVYDMESDALQELTGLNRDEVRFMVWEQLFLIFGDDFYKRLHRIVREEKVTGGSEQDRRLYLIWKSSQIAGYDLREFFNQWGIRLTDEAYKDTLTNRINRALENSAVVGLPKPVDSLMAVTGQSRPAWTPLPLRGITSSKPEVDFLPKYGWTIVTSFTGSKDGDVGGDKPEYIIDESKSTAFCFVKPGKNYNGVNVPADHAPSFTIDMKKPYAISYFRYAHRTGNSDVNLRASKVSLYGKNIEAAEFTPIKENIALTVSRDEELVTFPPTTCRYVQLVYKEWKSGGNTIQTAEFDLGPNSSVTPPTPDTSTSEQPDPPTGIWSSAALEDAPYVLYPNPVKAGQEFRIDVSSRTSFAKCLVRIYDAAGKKIRERVADTAAIVDVIYAPGIFFVSVESPMGRKVFKLAVNL